MSGEAAVAAHGVTVDDSEDGEQRALGSRAPGFVKSRRLLHLSWQVGVFIVGLAVVAAGAAMLVLPGPGWVVIFGGMAIWATEFVWAQLVLRWTKRKVTEAAQQPPADRCGVRDAEHRGELVGCVAAERTGELVHDAPRDVGLGRVRRCVDDPQVARGAQRVVHERRLSDAGRSLDEHDGRLAVSGGRDAFLEQPELLGPPDEPLSAHGGKLLVRRRVRRLRRGW